MALELVNQLVQYVAVCLGKEIIDKGLVLKVQQSLIGQRVNGEGL